MNMNDKIKEDAARMGAVHAYLGMIRIQLKARKMSVSTMSPLFRDLSVELKNVEDAIADAERVSNSICEMRGIIAGLEHREKALGRVAYPKCIEQAEEMGLA
jgi:hypothetical protein